MSETEKICDMKVCMVYNFAQLYREPIFRLIDGAWDCEWWFGRNTTDIKGMPEDALRKATYVENRGIAGSLYWQQGVGALMRRKDFNMYLMLGEPKGLSTWWALLQRRLFYRRKRVVLWSHGWYGREGFIKKWIKRMFFSMADHVLTYGQYAKDVAVAQGFDGNKITPIHNSLNHEKQTRLRSQLNRSNVYARHFGNEYPVLLFVGRLTRVKRLDMLLRAVKELDDRGERYNVVLIGDGEMRAELEGLTAELELTGRVWFYGACYDDTQNAQLIFDADLCVAPGNVGLTAMHTMVFGTPVLTHDDFSWQMPEFEAIRPGLTGDFFRNGDVHSLANAISSWFAAHADEREVIRRACYEEIDTRWTPQYQFQIIQNVFKTKI